MNKHKKPGKKAFIVIGTAIGVLAVVGVILFLAARNGSAPVAPQYVAVTRGVIRETIESTGTISAQKTIDVGTQVSGQLARVYADFNDRVRKGQVLARLDTTLLELAVQSAAAEQLKADASYQLALKDFNNTAALHEKALISDYDYESARVAKEQAYAGKVGADVNYNRARRNLDYAVITSPINGVIIHRAVEEGQTVAASMSTPTLFTIAEDLASIQIKALVPESDIGRIERGQRTTFTVTAHSDDVFNGQVDAIHLQSETVQNVVNYVVIVKAANKDGKLMPGMTATVTFIVDERVDALLVPNAALQYKPSEEMLARYREDRPAASSPPAGDESGARNGETRAGRDGAARNRSVRSPSSDGRDAEGSGQDAAPAPPANLKMLWRLDEDGRLQGIPVRTGLSDGRNTEIISDLIREGMRFLTNATPAARSSGSGQRGAPGPGFMFR